MATVLDITVFEAKMKSTNSRLDYELQQWLAKALRLKSEPLMGFPGEASGKEPACQCMRHKRCEKEELIQKILGYEFGEDRNANLDAMKAYQKEWLEIGFVPRADKDRIYTEYRNAINKRFAELKVSADDMRQSRYQSRIDDIMRNPNADKLIDKEKNFLTTKLARLKDDIVLWENNLGFFSNSKNAEILTAEFRKKIEAAKKEVEELEYKIKMMNNPKAAEQAEDKPETTEEAPAAPEAPAEA